MPKHCGTFIKCNNAEGCFGCEYEGEEDEEGSMNKVGTIVMLKKECLGNPQGALGVVFYNYGDGFQAIFPNGNLDGFSTDDKEEIFGGKTEAEFILEKVGFSELLSGYQFKNVMQVDWDFKSGVFDSVLKRENV